MSSMNIEFLKRLFTSCSEETGNGYRDGLNLSELYNRIEETAEAERRFRETRNKANLSSDEEDSICAAAYAAIRAYEMQGFVNGFHLHAQMGRELSRMDMTEDKIMAGGHLDNIIGRLIHCRAVLDTIQMAMGDDTLVDAVAGVCDLLDGISRDFQADIDSAEDYTVKETVG